MLHALSTVVGWGKHCFKLPLLRALGIIILGLCFRGIADVLGIDNPESAIETFRLLGGMIVALLGLSCFFGGVILLFADLLGLLGIVKLLAPNNNKYFRIPDASES